MILLMKTNRMARIFSVTKEFSGRQFSVLSPSAKTGCALTRTRRSGCLLSVSEISVVYAARGSKPGTDNRQRRSERAFLGKRVSREGCALRAFGDFHPHRRSFGRTDARRTQHGVLRKNLVIDLGDQIILPVGIAAPDLSEL